MIYAYVFTFSAFLLLSGFTVGYAYGITKPDRDQKRRAKEKYLRAPKAHRS
jgi:hypothetical protein